MNITKAELLSKYGINLEKGTYTVENLGDKYKINTLQDDTSGCILVGDKITETGITYSTTAYQRLFTLLTETLKKEYVHIEVINIPKPVKVIPVITKPIELPKEIILPEVVIKPQDIKQEPIKVQKLNWLEQLINIIKKWITKN